MWTCDRKRIFFQARHLLFDDGKVELQEHSSTRGFLPARMLTCQIRGLESVWGALIMLAPPYHVSFIIMA
jgi:hypothetical protein